MSKFFLNEVNIRNLSSIGKVFELTTSVDVLSGIVLSIPSEVYTQSIILLIIFLKVNPKSSIKILILSKITKGINNSKEFFIISKILGFKAKSEKLVIIKTANKTLKTLKK